jgi:hypothetical protein
MSTQLDVIYRDPKRVRDFKAGFRYAMKCAAEFVGQWDGRAPKHRLGDLLLCKFNLTARKPRKWKKKP